MDRRLLAIDGANLLMRALYGARLWSKENPDGWRQHLPGSVWLMINGLIRRSRATHLVLALDSEGPTFRHQALPEYKQNRYGEGPTARELTAELEKHFRNWGVVSVRAEGYEADDVLATLAARCVTSDTPIDIVSRDEDLLQTVKDDIVNVLWPEPGGDKRMTELSVYARCEVWPWQIACWKAISGCASDNIPKIGAPKHCTDGRVRYYGFTPKRAAELLGLFDDLEGVYGAPSTTFSAKELLWLTLCENTAFQMRDLIRLRNDVPLEIDPAATDVRNLMPVSAV